MQETEKKINILIIDDQIDITIILSELLSYDGYNIYTAHNGFEGLEKFNSIKPQIVLLDIKMPEMNGITVLKKMKQSLIDCEIIMMTGHTEINTAIEAIKEGAFTYLQKPTKYDHIKTAIDKALNKLNRQKNILIIEDDEIIRKRIKNLLQLDNYNIYTAENGIRGVKICKQIMPQVVLLDMKLPDIDGIEVLNIIKDNVKYTEVIMITGQGDINTAITSIKNGAFAFLQKPIEYELLKINIKNAIDKLYMKQKVLEDTKEHQTQVIQSAKMTALGELAAGVAHELKQPLNVITIIIQTILKDIKRNRFDLDEIEIDLIDAKKQVDRMADVIDHMKIFTRNSGYDNKISVQINEVVNSALKFFSEQLKVHNINLIKKLSHDIPEINGNPNHLEQVLINLISNARHAVEDSQKENMEIIIKTYNIPASLSLLNKESIGIMVKDNGNGIPVNIVQKIFDQFFTTKDPGKGTGLGLSISQKIIEEHNGKIILDMNTDKGAAFIIILPI